MRKITVAVFIFVAVVFSTVSAQYDVPSFDGELFKEITGNLAFSDMISQIISGEMPVGEKLTGRILQYVFGDIRSLCASVVTVIGLVILSSCIKGSQVKLGGNLSEIAFLICYFTVSSFLLNILCSAVETARRASEEIVVFTEMSLPAYIGIITSTGINAGASKGIFLAMVNIVSRYAGDFMINAFFYIAILTVVSNMSSAIHITKLISLARQVLFWVLGFILTVFAGMTTLSGLGASASSAVGIRAAKYTIGHAIPVVGGFLADSTELVLASAKIFKNAFGTAGIAVIAIVCLVPVLKLFVIAFMLKLSAGLTEPFCDNLMSDTIYQVGQSIIHIMVSVLLMSVMFILAFAVLINL